MQVKTLYYKDKSLKINSFRDNNKSHNHMATFFSATDLNTLLEEGKDVNHFVSLIVNNAGKYTAAVTRHIKSNSEGVEHCTYNSWNNKEHKFDVDFLHDKEYVEYFNLAINKEEDDADTDIVARFNEIKEEKDKATYIPTGKVSSLWPGSNYWYNKDDYKKNDKLYNQPDLFDDVNPDDDVPYYKGSDIQEEFDEETIDCYVKQILGCSMFIGKNNKLTVEDVAANVYSLYPKRFKCMKDFDDYAMGVVDFFMYNADYDEINATNDDEHVSMLAHQIVERLESLNVDNVYIDKWIELFKEYYI